jgi:WhiB family transcriptional regulator, redox-sensing transcriptional regulator
MDWRHEAACREVDPELFFPIGNTGPALLQIEEAKQVCCRCSVMNECLRWAIDSGQDAGVWGGMSEDERRALKRRTIRLRARAHVLPPQLPHPVTALAGNPGYATRIRRGD